MQYRIVARRGTLVFGGVSFSTRPAIYEMSAEEVSVIQSLYGDRLLMELVEPEQEDLEPEQEAGEPDHVESGRPRSRRRSAAAGPPSGEPGESQGV